MRRNSTPGTSLSIQFLPLRIFAVFAMTGLTACSLLQRHPESGYHYGDHSEHRWNSEKLEAENKAYQEALVREELGWETSKPLSETEGQLLQERLTLKQLEQSIETLAEKKQYYRYKGVMENDKERIHFLRLPIEAREGWATHRGYNAEEEGYSDEIAEVIENNDVAMGMSHKAVVESWGDPDAVEVAGNPIYGNQRWRYSRYISSNDGYQKVEKILYFESGRLVGWETY